MNSPFLNVCPTSPGLQSIVVLGATQTLCDRSSATSTLTSVPDIVGSNHRYRYSIGYAAIEDLASVRPNFLAL